MAAIPRWQIRGLILQIASSDSRNLCQKHQNITHWCIVMFQIKTALDPLDMKSKWRLFQNGVWHVTTSRSVTEYCMKVMKFSTVIAITISNQMQIVRNYSFRIWPRCQDGRHFLFISCHFYNSFVEVVIFYAETHLTLRYKIWYGGIISWRKKAVKFRLILP